MIRKGTGYRVQGSGRDIKPEENKSPFHPPLSKGERGGFFMITTGS
jgi:hypothetical protein